jgi:hypothetical protein
VIAATGQERFMTSKLMQNKTKSKIPRNASDKSKWIASRKLVAKQAGATAEKNVPWALVNHIYQNEKKAGKTIKAKDIKKAKVSKAVKSYVREK